MEPEKGWIASSIYRLTYRPVNWYINKQAEWLAPLAGVFGALAAVYALKQGLPPVAVGEEAVLTAGSWAAVPFVYQTFDRWLENPRRHTRFAFAAWMTRGPFKRGHERSGFPLIRTVAEAIGVAIVSTVVAAHYHAAPLGAYPTLMALTPLPFRFAYSTFHFHEKEEAALAEWDAEHEGPQADIAGPDLDPPDVGEPTAPIPTTPGPGTRRTTAPTKATLPPPDPDPPEVIPFRHPGLPGYPGGGTGTRAPRFPISEPPEHLSLS